MMRILTALLLVFIISENSQADTFGLKSSEAAIPKAFLEDIESLIPESFKRTINWDVKIQSGLYKKFKDVSLSKCEPQALALASLPIDYLGDRKKMQVIELHQALVTAAQQGPLDRTSTCGHKRDYDVAVAAVLHQLALIYDGQAKISERPDFQKLAGFFRFGSGFRPVQEADPNGPATNVIAGIRTRSPREFFAASFSTLALNRDFACERPAIALYLSRELRMPNEFLCDDFWSIQFKLPDSPEGVLIPSRVFRIDLLRAEPGDEFLESFGHIMFRIVQCAPDRETVGPECLSDTSSHIVMTFNGDGTDRDGLTAGLTGKIPAKLFALPLINVFDDYEGQGRKMWVSALRLSEDEKIQLIYLLIERNRSYSGRWYDLTNNCVAHSLDVLEASLNPGRVKNLSPLTPSQFEKFLRLSKVTSRPTILQLPK
jgi:hypothetical protein